MDGPDLHFDDRMSDEDALLWALDAQAALTSTITVVVMFEGSPVPAALASRLELLTRRVPRLRHRVVESPLRTAPPRWEPDPSFALERHVSQVALGDSFGLSSVLRLAESLAVGPFRPGRPPWEMQLVTGDDGAALVLKLHHSFTDGVGLVEMAAEVFDLSPGGSGGPGGPGGPGGAVGEGAPAGGSGADGYWTERAPAERVWEDLNYEAHQAWDVLRSVVPWVASSVRSAVADPASRGAEVFGARLAAVQLPMAELRDTAHRAGGTLNDVFLAGLLGGLREYHAKHGCHPPSLRLGVPISTRQRGVGVVEMHNQVTPMLVRAPLQLLDPVERIRLLHELVAQARRHPAIDVLQGAAGVVRRLPGATTLIKSFVGAVDVLASNVPGSPVDLYLGGARVERIIPIGPRGGTALNLTLLSHTDSVDIGVNMDPIAIPDPDVLVDCVRFGFEETLAV
jgi:diacylglycerol O-acyltransferase